MFRFSVGLAASVARPLDDGRAVSATRRRRLQAQRRLRRRRAAPAARRRPAPAPPGARHCASRTCHRPPGASGPPVLRPSPGRPRPALRPESPRRRGRRRGSLHPPHAPAPAIQRAAPASRAASRIERRAASRAAAPANPAQRTSRARCSERATERAASQRPAEPLRSRAARLQQLQSKGRLSRTDRRELRTLAAQRAAERAAEQSAATSARQPQNAPDGPAEPLAAIAIEGPAQPRRAARLRSSGATNGRTRGSSNSRTSRPRRHPEPAAAGASHPGGVGSSKPRRDALHPVCAPMHRRTARGSRGAARRGSRPAPRGSLACSRLTFRGAARSIGPTPITTCSITRSGPKPMTRATGPTPTTTSSTACSSLTARPMPNTPPKARMPARTAACTTGLRAKPRRRARTRHPGDARLLRGPGQGRHRMAARHRSRTRCSRTKTRRRCSTDLQQGIRRSRRAVQGRLPRRRADDAARPLAGR